MSDTPRLVLASASPRRAAILRRLGLDPEIAPARLDERYLPGETPVEHVERLARAKAEAVASAHGGALVLGGDTVVVLQGRVLGKPADPEQAVRMLMALAGRVHHVLTGLAVVEAGSTYSGVQRTEVRFRDFDEALARGYVETGEPMDKAGAYGIQGRGTALVDAIEGDYEAVVGLPVGLLIQLLLIAGWRYTFRGLEPREGGEAR